MSGKSEEFKAKIYKSKTGQHSIFVPSYVFKHKLDYKDGKDYLVKITELSDNNKEEEES